MKRNAMMMAAVAGLMAGPAMAMETSIPHRSPNIGWTPPKWGKSRSKRQQRDASRLQLHGWPEVPCEAPTGYFWKRDASGKRKYRLYRSPPHERTAVYDERNDRSIITSGWGYRNPTYAPGDVRQQTP